MKPGFLPRAATPGATPPGATELNRTLLAEGGLVNDDTLSDELTPFEREDRVRPVGGVHDPIVSPARPVVIPISSYTVPARMTLLIYDYLPNIYRFSGVDPEDVVPVSPQRFSGQMGWEVMVSGKPIGDLGFGLIPRVTTPPAPTSQNGPITAFQIAQTRSGANLGAGLLPQRLARVGAPNTPYTLVVKESQTFTASAKIFRPIQSPVAFFSFGFSGFLAPAKYAERLMDKLKPVRD